jgi:hypothetical protein
MLLLPSSNPLDGPPIIEYISLFNKKRTFSLWESEDKKPSLANSLEQLIEEEWLPEATFLKAKNPHPKDGNIKMYEINHIYEVKYRDTVTSDNIAISTLAHKYFPPFDAEKRMKEIRNDWNRYKQYYNNLSDEEIKKSWEENRERCSRQGTFFHRLFENACNGYDLSISKFNHLLPVKQYLKWRREFFDSRFEEFRTELRMYSQEDLRIVGTADLIAVRKNHPPPTQTKGVLYLSIFDWKNSKKLEMKSKEKGFGPCKHLDSCNFIKYSIQQNLYKYLLEHYYSSWIYNDKSYTSVKVECMKLIIVHDNHVDQQAHMVDVPEMTPLIEELIQLRRQELQAPSYIALPNDV